MGAMPTLAWACPRDLDISHAHASVGMAPSRGRGQFAVSPWRGCGPRRLRVTHRQPGAFRRRFETIHIPVFQSASFRRDLGEQLTEAVIKEEPEAHALSRRRRRRRRQRALGRITNNTKHLLLETPTATRGEEEYDLMVSVRWVNRRGDVIRQGPPLKVPPDAVDVNSAVHFASEYGQSTASAQLVAIQQLARRIVDLMESPW